MEFADLWHTAKTTVAPWLAGTFVPLALLYWNGHPIPWFNSNRCLSPSPGIALVLFLVLPIYAIYSFTFVEWVFEAVPGRQHFLASVAAVEIAAGRGVLTGAVERARKRRLLNV